MKGAAKRIDEEIDWFRRRARNLIVADCEGDRELHQDMTSILRLVANILEYRHKYLKIVPWSFSQADTASGAAAFVDDVTSHASEKHDPLTLFLYDSNREALELLRDTGECLPELVEAVEEVNDTPMDEGAGEGYHRSTHHTRVRAYNARSPYIKQAIRCKDNLKHIRQFMLKCRQGK